MDSRNDIINIVLITQEGKALYNNANLELKDDIQFEDYDWYQKAKQEEKFTVSNSHIQRLFFKNQYKWVVSCSTLLKSPITTKI